MELSEKDLERFWKKVDKEGENGCWLWLSAKDGPGYGIFRLHGRMEKSHRIAYFLANGAIPEGLQLDHLCRVRHCINPHHLEAVTQRVNIYRGVSPAAINIAKTHCLHGHDFTPENTYFKPTSCGIARQCRECGRKAQRIYERKKRSRTRRLVM